MAGPPARASLSVRFRDRRDGCAPHRKYPCWTSSATARVLAKRTCVGGTPLSAVSSTKGVRALLNGSSLPVFGTTPSLLLASSERGTPATASGSASGTTTSTPTLVRELFVGCKVKLAAGFEDVSDASSGPPQPR